MTALDTNVIIRLISRDDPAQCREAHRLLTSTLCFIPDTVLLEAVWVLRSRYNASPQQIHAELSTLLGLPNVRVADAQRIRAALDWFGGGLDFADALHLASAQHAEAFATFDRRFINRAAGKGSCPVQKP
jgi:predicted nucleic acid-binding protein